VKNDSSKKKAGTESPICGDFCVSDNSYRSSAFCNNRQCSISQGRKWTHTNKKTHIPMRSVPAQVRPTHRVALKADSVKQPFHLSLTPDNNMICIRLILLVLPYHAHQYPGQMQTVRRNNEDLACYTLHLFNHVDGPVDVFKNVCAEGEAERFVFEW